MIKITKAQSLNFSKIQLLAKSIWHEHYTPIIGVKQVEYMLEKYQSIEAMTSQINEGYVYYCVEIDDELIGYFSIKIDHLRFELFLSKFYIVKSQRGNGVGKEVVLYIKKIMKSSGMQTIRLTVNKYNSNSIKAYQNFGFKISKEVVFQIGQGFIMDDYEMVYNEEL